MSQVTFQPRSAFALKNDARYHLMPFRFARLPKPQGTVLVTSDTGEFALLDEREFAAFVTRELSPDSETYALLRSRRFLSGGDDALDVQLLATQLRTKKSFLLDGPCLHLFVVTLRCDHSCAYCQVSRQNAHADRFDMSPETMRQAVERVFESPSRRLSIEFQGGEPALNFDAVRAIVEMVEKRNRDEDREIQFTIATTLHLFDEEMLQYCKAHRIGLSTSLDGPAFLHNQNRPTPKRDGHQRTIEAIARARAVVGFDNVSALTTLTRASLDHPKAIIQEYVKHGFKSIFLRPLSPYGFARRTQGVIGYSMEEFLAFYREALDYLIELNLAGTPLEEVYTGLLLNNILTPFPTGYVDLRSPSGQGLGCLVYNYDGQVYAADEGRMLAETGDTRFALGHVSQSYTELMRSEPMRWIMSAGIAESLPGCSDCAFQPYCGADPVFHAGRQGDPFGHRPTSDFCRKHTGLFNVLFEKLANAEADTMRVFTSWATRRGLDRIPVAGLMA